MMKHKIIMKIKIMKINLINNQENQEQNQIKIKKNKKAEEDNQGVDTDYDFTEHQLEENLVDTDSEKENSENLMQKIKKNYPDLRI